MRSSALFRVLCETVKDFVARVGKAYERAPESSEESEVMARKVFGKKEHSNESVSSPFQLHMHAYYRDTIKFCVLFLVVLCFEREVGFSFEDTERRISGFVIFAKPTPYYCRRSRRW